MATSCSARQWYVVHRYEMRNHDADLGDAVRRRRELHPQIGAALRGDVLAVATTNAVVVSVVNRQIFLLVRGIDEIYAADGMGVVFVSIAGVVERIWIERIWAFI